MDLNSVMYSDVRYFCSFVPKTVELFLNKKEDLIPEAVPSAISNGAAENISASSSSSPIPVPPEPNALKISGTEANGPRQEERNSLKIFTPSIRKEDARSNSVQTPVGTHKEEKILLGTLNEDKVAKRVKLSDEALGGSRENKIRKAWAEENVSQSLPCIKHPSPSRKSSANGVLQPEQRPVVLTGILKNGNKIEDRAEVPKKRDADGKFKQPVVLTGGLKVEKKAGDQVEEVSKRVADPQVRLMLLFFVFPFDFFSHLFDCVI